jgi:hypothetical protein
MTRKSLYGLALGAALCIAAGVAHAAWDSKFFYAGSFAVGPGTNNKLTLPFGLKGQYAKCTCHDDAGSPNPVDAWLGSGKADGTSGTSFGSSRCVDAGVPTCDLYRFSMGEKFYVQQLPQDDSVWGTGTDAGICDCYVAGN